MAEYNALLEKAGDRYIAALKSAYGAGVSTVSSVSETIGGWLPQLPQFPFAERLPKPTEIVKTYFDFVQDLTKAQRDYALGLIDAVAPVTEKVMPATTTRKPARRASTRKAA